MESWGTGEGSREGEGAPEAEGRACAKAQETASVRDNISRTASATLCSRQVIGGRR